MNEPTHGVVNVESWKGQRVVKKKARKEIQEDSESILREVDCLKRLADRHIIQFYDTEYVTEDGLQKLVLVLEYAEGGSLNKAIPRLQWSDKERIAGEIAHGLSYIHSLGIIHCDIKGANVVLTKKLEAKLCDFGSAMTTAERLEKKRSLGTKGWMAPEFLEDATAYSPESDIYALGIVMWEMASSKEPFSRAQVLEEKLVDVPLEYYRVMQACWNEDPKRRPGVREILFFKYGYSFKEVQEMLKRLSFGDVGLDRKDHQILSKLVEGAGCGDADADICVNRHVELGKAYPDDQGTPENSSALELGLELADDDEFSALELGLELADDDGFSAKARKSAQYYNSRHYDQALDYARQISHHPAVSFLMSEMYSKGNGVEMNQGEAYKWQLKAAEGGLAISQHWVGVHFFRVGNHLEALKWYRKAAEQGNRDGEYKLGIMYYYGHGVLEDHQEGERWIRKAADQGCTVAAAGMGNIYLNQKRYAQAMSWCFKAVGNPRAEYYIGIMYRSGWGVSPHYGIAMEWFQRSAKKQFDLAAFAIAKMYHLEQGVSRDLKKAIEWYSRAKEYGDLDAENEMAIVYQEMEHGVSYTADELLTQAEQKGHLLAKANGLLGLL
ncbi:hypothetical protein BGX28_007799 [Mortierella sp. GBA30]|nr:hypothetical protein BGX28_007799 [Mortierella sp. GBA30]